jgi:ATP-binding cassette subfamily C protein CydC
MKTIARLLNLIAPFSGWIALSILLSFATVGASVGLMAMSAFLISKSAIVTVGVDLSLIITAVRGFALARAALRYAERYLTHTISFRILTRLRLWFYVSIEKLAPARLLQYRSGDLLTRIMADIETLENFYVRVVVPPLAAVLVTALTCLILGTFNVWLGVALLGFLALAGVVLPLTVQRLSRVPATQVVATRAELNSALVDEVQGIADLLSFGQETHHNVRLLTLSQRLSRIQEGLAVVRGMGNALGGLLASLAGLTVLALAIPLVSGGRINGVFLALLPLTALASFEAVQSLPLAWQNLEASQAAARRLFALIDAEPAVVAPPQPSPRPLDYSLEVRNVRFAYAPGEAPVLDGVSFSVPSGGRLGIVGPSGGGKTTLVNLLLRFWDYQAGSILLGRQDLRTYQPDDVRDMMSVIAQDTYLFNGTVRDNLLLADPDASDHAIVAAARHAQLDEFISGLPDGYDTWIGENGVLLSGGERQRLAIARAILKDAPILILDEPTAHLDAVTEQNVFRALHYLMTGRTSLIISHRPLGPELVDQILILGGGRMVAHPSAPALLIESTEASEMIERAIRVEAG